MVEQFEIPGMTGDWDTGMLRLVADPERIRELIPLRRGPVQGPAVWRPPAQTERQPEARQLLVAQAEQPAPQAAAPGR
ncbi:MAG: hypothetical protein HOW97_34775, partial [Catenulispora sp.]|nr:hypothetical protein [Catenulispora sp.]